jgi:deoxyribodipyrimidine photo-lyase
MKSARQQLEAAGLQLVVGGSNYAVAPGNVRKPDGSPYRVYTPFYRAWLNIGWETPYELTPGAKWVRDNELHLGFDSPSYSEVFEGSPTNPRKLKSIKAGEAFALRTFKRFIERGALVAYDEGRNMAGISGTSHLSHALAHGEIHPRTLLSRLGDSAGEVVFAKELAWREFYADVLWHNPHSLTDYLEPRFAKMRYDDGSPTGEERFEAWKLGRTGFPMVDAGMRQLLADGWVHNRVRMIVASFLIKDLHIEWQRGAEWFEMWLTDFDPASNSQGWQWTAGCGTDASPYYRVFNPILQGLKFDPEGNYVRKYVPELRGLPGASVHEPWLLPEGILAGYPDRIVDHGQERDESLARLAEIKGL